MAFTVTFYRSSANPKKLDKSGDLTMIGTTKTLHVKHQMDALNPVFDVDYNAAFIAANYCYIAEFGRYYYCTVSTDTAQRITIRATVDYLFSHADAIKQCPVTVVRSEAAGINMVVDNQLPIDPNRINVHGEQFPYTPIQDNEEYLIITNGGVISGT